MGIGKKSCRTMTLCCSPIPCGPGLLVGGIRIQAILDVTLVNGVSLPVVADRIHIVPVGPNSRGITIHCEYKDILKRDKDSGRRQCCLRVASGANAECRPNDVVARGK
jgi:hypothetical protein